MSAIIWFFFKKNLNFFKKSSGFRYVFVFFLLENPSFLPSFLTYLLMNWFCQMVDQQKVFMPYFQLGPLSQIFTIVNFWHATNWVWTYTESEFRHYWMKLYSIDDHHTREKHLILHQKNIRFLTEKHQISQLILEDF